MKYPVLQPATLAPIMLLLNALEENPNLLALDPSPYKGDALRVAKAFSNHAKVTNAQPSSSALDEFGDFDGDDEDFKLDGSLNLDESLNLDINASVFSGESWERILEQTEIIYSSLMLLREKVQRSNKADPNKVMNFYKNLGTLLEKIISLRERGTEAKEIHDFKNRVIWVIDNVLTPEQRTEAIGKMSELQVVSSEKEGIPLKIGTDYSI